MNEQEFVPVPNPHPEVVTVGRIVVSAAPKNMRKLCERYNLSAGQRGNPYMLSATQVDRPGGHTNYHVRLEGPGIQRMTWSMTKSDDEACKEAVRELLKRAGAPAADFC
jgi:hypothetical protein